MRPPTPSTRSVTPIRSGATSWTLRAKKLRRSIVERPARVVADEGRECERNHRATDDAQQAARRDREAEARRVGQCARFQVADRWRSRDLHELDPRHAPE